MKKINIIIPAAGLGTRMQPISAGGSKTLIPINGKPILRHILERLSVFDNIGSIVIVTNKHLTDIDNYLISNKYLFPENIRDKIFTTAQIHDFTGPAAAIECGVQYIKDLECAIDTFRNTGTLVWLSDNLFDISNKDVKFLDFYKDFSFFIKRLKHESQRWCIAHNGKIYDKIPENSSVLDELPEHVLAFAGLYYFSDTEKLFNSTYLSLLKPLDGKPDENSSIYSKFENLKGEYQISDLINVYLDGKSFNNFQQIELAEQQWYDCGELETFYQTKARLLSNTTRAQTRMTVDTDLATITKKASYEAADKLIKEYYWYQTCKRANVITPKIFNSGWNENSIYGPEYFYTMSYEQGYSLADLWEFSNVPVSTWKYILKKFIDIHHQIFYKTKKILKKKDEGIDFTEKTLTRLSEHRKLYENLLETEGADFDETLCKIKKLLKYIKKNEVMVNRIHGDLHFGNILFDPIIGKFTIIDPRGETGPSDIQLEYGKLYHDVFADYMDINNHNFFIQDYDIIIPSNTENKKAELLAYMDYLFEIMGYNPVSLKAIGTILVFTCIPFHLEDPEKVQGFIINSLDKIDLCLTYIE